MTATENIDAPELEAPIDNEQEVLDEGEVAADYLEELLDIADLDGDIDIEIRGGRTYISIVTEDDDTSLDSLVGENGETLDALQELTRLAVLTATGERSRLILDIAGYRADRAEQLKKLAEDAIANARDTGEKVHLEPMSAYERKLVHDVIAEAGLHSESEGESTRRHIVVSVLDS
ncbi:MULTISPECIES: Jag family protein [Glutamicibacter]|uniref:RNA-binding protein n=1 Tax=Glutamicibacter halophytocola TaxID=1933880 RepID=A0A5B8INB7_9MICC|nr:MULTISPECIES: R3H domain-containing nucleic acid-binding protein [Glutamicibacter]MBF6673090.1 RNA-binding protein [Glutamicibacter sp. FBE19]NQD42579.1 RNA-binding protein [Glutamicibacter halophytocola]QDY66923.1 RNA-binding protein [Glutamicibacter halophytocola]UUX59070.1 RNA-binding protein [Glutamicibacter halophytocola]